MHNKHIEVINKENSLFISRRLPRIIKIHTHFFFFIYSNSHKISLKIDSNCLSNSHKSSLKFSFKLFHIGPSTCWKGLFYTDHFPSGHDRKSKNRSKRDALSIPKYKRPSIHLVGFPRREGLYLCLYLESSHRYKWISVTNCYQKWECTVSLILIVWIDIYCLDSRGTRNCSN